MKSLENTVFLMRSRVSIVLLLSLLTIVACQRKKQHSNLTALPSDEEIKTVLQTHLKQSQEVPFEHIKVSVQEGIVTLSGSTDHILAKKQAAKIAGSVHGVLSVVNNIKVTAARPDEAVSKDINEAIRQDAAAKAWEVAAMVNNGHVVLKGVADSWQQRQLVGTIAQGVKGVKGIENNIIVNQNDSRSDEEIQREIQNALMMDSRIRNNRITVTVNDGHVELSGAVGSAREKTLAFEQSHVAGVESVSVDNLEVHPEFRSQMFRNGKLTSLTSEDIRKAVKRSLTYDPRVPESRITVTVEDGTVTLKGKVNNLNAKLAAERDALHTAGVSTVDNEIVVEHKVVVRPGIPTTNEAIAARIREAIIRYPYVERDGFEISVRDGVVELKGTADTRFEKRKIAELAANVMGVIAIDNEITVSVASTAAN